MPTRDRQFSAGLVAPPGGGVAAPTTPPTAARSRPGVRGCGPPRPRRGGRAGTISNGWGSRRGWWEATGRLSSGRTRGAPAFAARAPGWSRWTRWARGMSHVARAGSVLGRPRRRKSVAADTSLIPRARNHPALGDGSKGYSTIRIRGLTCGVRGRWRLKRCRRCRTSFYSPSSLPPVERVLIPFAPVAIPLRYALGRLDMSRKARVSSAPLRTSPACGGSCPGRVTPVMLGAASGHSLVSGPCSLRSHFRHFMRGPPPETSDLRPRGRRLVTRPHLS